MIICSSDFKHKGFGIKKFVRKYNDDVYLVADKTLSARKRKKLKKYILAIDSDRILNLSELDIVSYGCCNEDEVINAVFEKILSKKTLLELNDEKGYALNAVKKYIRNFSSVRIYGNEIYKSIQKECYLSNGISIVISENRIKNAIDTDSVYDKIKNISYYDMLPISYADMIRYHGVKILDTAYLNLYN